MSDTAIKNATEQKERLEKEISALERDLAKKKGALAQTKGFIQAWHAFVEKDFQTQFLDLGDVPVTSQTRKKPQNPKKEFVAARAAEIIASTGRPMPRAELFKALEQQDIVLKGSNPEMVLSTMLWRCPDVVVRLPPHGYWLADRPYDPAGYDPKKTTPDVFG